MDKQTIFNAVQDIFRDNFDDDTLVLTRAAVEKLEARFNG